jgi:argininosuccinate synthase
MQLKTLNHESVGMCVSGGLSSLAVAGFLAEAGIETTAFVADIGQAPQAEISALAGSLEKAGLKTVVVDLRDAMAQFALDLVYYQAQYEGGYWNTTSGSRMVLVSGLAEAIQSAGCTALGHGCVGGGNDQRRFDRYTAKFAPDLHVIAPWTEPELLERFPSRSAMAQYVAARGLAGDPRCTPDYSVDGSVAGFAHEGSELERLETADSAVRPILMVSPEQAPDRAEPVLVKVDGGRPAEVGGRGGSAHELLAQANAIAGRNGVGLRSVVEDRINGTKCRGMYEAPGLDLLGFCVNRVHQVSMDKPARRLMSTLSELIGQGAYEGRYLDSEIRAARAAADELIAQADASADVDVIAYKGGLSFGGLTYRGSGVLPPRQTRFTGGGHQWQVRP